MENHNFLSYLSVFIQTILKFENSLQKKYGFVSSPFTVLNRPFPAAGTLEVDGKTAMYDFHGAGCDIFVDGVEFRYDGTGVGERVGSIKIKAWKFLQFLKTFHESSHYDWKIEEIKAEFDKLVLEGKVAVIEDFPYIWEFDGNGSNYLVGG
jgi:hypothetical protein